MKRHKQLVLIAAILLLAALTVGSALAASDPFVGGWVSIDTDGSNQGLKIGGIAAARYRVTYHDEGATICGAPDPVTGEWPYAAQARGFASQSAANFIEGTWDYSASGRRKH